MPAALLTITLGAILVYSAIKGIGITDVLSGKEGDKINPHGADVSSIGGITGTAGGTDGAPLPGDLAQGGTWTPPPGGEGSFKGPNAAVLDTLAGVAQNQFHLKITATTNGGHVFDSWHFKGRAFDASGSEADMRAFSQYLLQNYGGQLLELIHNPGFAVKNGVEVSPLTFASVWAGHRNHVHVAM